MRLRRLWGPMAEVGVVVLLLGVLALIFLPSLGRAHESARRSSCQNNLKQLGLVMKMYANESQGRIYPPLSPIPNNWMMEMRAVYPEYLSDLNVLRCPSNPLAGTGVFELKSNLAHPNAKIGDLSPDCVSSLSYIYTGYRLTSDSQALALFNASLRLPAETFTHDLILEVAVPEGPEPAQDPQIADPAALARYESSIPVMWDRVAIDPVESSHVPSGSNVLYADGHVSFTRFTWSNDPEQFPVTPSNAETFGCVLPNLPNDCYGS